MAAEVTDAVPPPAPYPRPFPVRRWLRVLAVLAACLGVTYAWALWMTAAPGEIWVRTVRDELGASYEVRLSEGGAPIHEHGCDWSVFRTTEETVHLHWALGSRATTRERVLDSLRVWLSRPHCVQYGPTASASFPPGEAPSLYVRADPPEE